MQIESKISSLALPAALLVLGWASWTPSASAQLVGWDGQFFQAGSDSDGSEVSTDGFLGQAGDGYRPMGPPPRGHRGHRGHPGRHGPPPFGPGHGPPPPMDLDNDGEVSDEEKASFHQARVEEILARFDQDGDGALSETEWIEFRSRRPPPPPELTGSESTTESEESDSELEAETTSTFSSWDADGDTLLNLEELSAGLLAEHEERMAALDSDGDGEVSAEERQAAFEARREAHLRGSFGAFQGFENGGQDDGFAGEGPGLGPPRFGGGRRGPPGHGGPGRDPSARLAELDQDGDGSLSLEEFQAGMPPQPPAFSSEKLEGEETRPEPPSPAAIFAEIDTDQDGLISGEEMAAHRPPHPGPPRGPHRFERGIPPADSWSEGSGWTQGPPTETWGIESNTDD